MTKNIEDVMTKENLVTAKEGVTLEGAQQILKTHKIEKLPIVDEEGHLKGLITIKDIEKKIQYLIQQKTNVEDYYVELQLE